jgi:hypothetical protein
MAESKIRDASVNGVMSLMESVRGARRFTSTKPKPTIKKKVDESYTSSYANDFHKAENPEPLRLQKEEKKLAPKVVKESAPKMVKEELFLRQQDNLEIKLNALQRQITSVSNSVNTMSENTLVTGIGQGGDGQTPGSGEVRLLRLDDVSADLIQVGESLVWDGDKFIPDSSAAGGNANATDIRIADVDITNWNESYGWGNHADENYLKSYTEIDPIFDASPARTITTPDIQKWNESHSWGDHALGGYLKTSPQPVTFSDTEPTIPEIGMLWFNTVGDVLSTYDPNGNWIQIN